MPSSPRGAPLTDADAVMAARTLGIAAAPIEGHGPVAMIATDLLDQQSAVALYRTARRARDATGLTPILVEPDALQRADASVLAGYARITVADVLRRHDDRIRDDGGMIGAFEAALDGLGVITDTDPMTILHRIPLLDIPAIESGEIEDPFDEIGVLPDDVGEAYQQQLAERVQLVAGARGGTILASQARTPDETAALDELGCGPIHLVLIAASPALALLHLGFGAFNDCPAPPEHARIWEYWHTRHGAEPIAVGRDRLNGMITRPVTSRQDLVRLAEEVAIYDGDLLAEGPLYLLATLYRNATFDCWWD